MGSSASALTGIPPPPAGFVPEQAGSVPPPPPGFVPEADREVAHQARVAKQVAGAKAAGKLGEETSRPILGARAEQGILPTLGRAATGLGGMFKEAVTLIPSGVIPFANKYFVQPQMEQFRKAGEAQTFPEKAAYTAAGILPIAGPIAASAGEQIGGGDIAGGLTTGALALATSRAPEDVIRAGTKTARTGTAMVKTGAENLGLRAPEAPKALRQAIQPSVTVPRAGESIDIAGPRLQQVRQGTGAEYNSPADLLEGIKAAKASVHDAIEQRLGPVATLQADTSGVAKAMEGSISGRTARQYPATAEKIQTRAATYRGNLSLREIENSIQDANNQLRDFYKRPVATDSPISADTAATEAEVRTLRKLLDDKVSQLQGAGVADLKREYGALRDVERSTARANAVATRQKGATLWEGLAALRAAGDFASGNVLGAAKGAATLAVGRMLQKMRDPNYLIQQAFQGKRAFPAAGEIPPAAGPNIRGLLPSGATQLGPVPDTSGIIPPGQGMPMPGFATREPKGLLPAPTGPTVGPTSPFPLRMPPAEQAPSLGLPELRRTSPAAIPGETEPAKAPALAPKRTPEKAAVKPTPNAKEPWQMTREEAKADIKKKVKGPYDSWRGIISPGGWGYLTEPHRIAVQNALDQGKPVPAEILADYPDLKRAGMIPETERKSTVAARESVEQQVRHAYLDLSGGRHSEMIRLAHLKQALSHIPSQEVDEALFSMQKRGEVSLQTIESMQQTTEADRRAAIKILGEDRNILYLFPRK